jgi:hypothetical protein
MLGQQYGMTSPGKYVGGSHPPQPAADHDDIVMVTEVWLGIGRHLTENRGQVGTSPLVWRRLFILTQTGILATLPLPRDIPGVWMHDKEV